MFGRYKNSIFSNPWAPDFKNLPTEVPKVELFKNMSVYPTITKVSAAKANQLTVWCRFKNSDEKFKKALEGPERLEMFGNGLA